MTAAENRQPDLSVRDTAEFDDPRRPLVWTLKVGAWALVAITVVSLLAWGATRDLPGVWGALMGAAIGGGFVLATVITVLATSNMSPIATMAVVLGGWVIKMAVTVWLLSWLRPLEFYDPTAFGVSAIAALVVALGVETWGVLTSQTAYVSA